VKLEPEPSVQKPVRDQSPSLPVTDARKAVEASPASLGSSYYRLSK
jgi:hypothetical protein